MHKKLKLYLYYYFNNINMAKLNETLQNDIKNKSQTLFDTLKSEIQYADNETLDIYLHYVYANTLSHSMIDTLCLFHERKMLTKMHIDNIIRTHTNEFIDILINRIHLNYDNDTLILYCGPRMYYASIIPLLNIMIEYKQIINDAGSYVMCKYLDTKSVIKYLNIFFDMGYVPSAILIKYLAKRFEEPINQGMITIFMNEIIMKFKLLLPHKIEAYCKAYNIKLYDKPLTLEEKFKYYKISCFKKELKNDTKITQQCLYNACSLRNNVSSIKILISKYNLKPDTKCLEISTSVPKNTKVNNYLIENGVYVSNQCMFNLIRNGTCQVSIKWKEQQQPTSNALQISGIDDA